MDSARGLLRQAKAEPMRPNSPKKLLQKVKITMQKPLETMPLVGYSASVTETSVTGFDSPIVRRTHRPSSQFGGFFASDAQHCSCLGGGVRGALSPPVPDSGLSTRTLPPFLRLTAQWVVYLTLKSGACA